LASLVNCGRGRLGRDKPLNCKLPLFFLIYTAFLCNSCSTAQDSQELHNKPLITDQQSIIYGSLIKKPFIRKNGVPTKNKELYFNYNNKSYFIKFCESQVSRQTVERLYSSNSIGFTFEVELAEGEWDICDKSSEQQSRTGKYMLLHNFIE
jgi:hypothetical protein